MRYGAIVAVAAVVVGFGAAASPTIAIPGHMAVIVHGPMDVADSIVKADLAFDARSAAVGPAQAMREFMDPADGLSFTGSGGPVRGAEAIFAAHSSAKPGTLSWVPAEVFADHAGEMGATWGHFQFVPPGGGTKVVTGRYVTVWRKRDGVWKGIIDIGDPD